MQVNTQTAKQQPPARADASAAAPAGAPADDAPAETDEWRELLRAVLTHGGIRSDVSSICRLLCTSKAAAAVVGECCLGALCMYLKRPEREYSGNGREQLAARCNAHAAWLRRNGSLVKMLELERDYLAESGWPAQSALAHLLPAIASSASQVQQLKGEVEMAGFTSAAEVRSAGSSLAALTSLTHLVLHLGSCEGRHGRAEDSDSRGSEHSVFVVSPAPILSSLQRLPSLRSCDLLVSGCGPRFMLMNQAGLTHLPTQLTSLQLSVRLGLQSIGLEGCIADMGGVEDDDGDEDYENGVDNPFLGMPVLYPSTPQPPLDLGHLTALKELMPSTLWKRDAELGIRVGDVLPPNITRLELDADCRSLGGLLTGPLSTPTVEPLTRLTRLQELTIRHQHFCAPGSRASAQQLKDLAAALKPPRGALRAVSLNYTRMARAVAASGGWSSLPLVSLSIRTNRYSDGIGVRGMVSTWSTLTALTQLHIECSHFEAPAKQLAAVLVPLSNLQVLILDGSLKADQPDSRSHSAAATEVFSNRLAALPSLVHLAVGSNYRSGFPVSAAVINNGPYRHQLTHLELKGCLE